MQAVHVPAATKGVAQSHVLVADPWHRGGQSDDCTLMQLLCKTI